MIEGMDERIQMALYVAAIALGVALCIAAPGCATVKPGSACNADTAYCKDGQTALACEDHKLTTYHCGGTVGCWVDASAKVFCDQSKGALPGEACLPAYAGLGECSVDDSAMLQCVNGVWLAYKCPGTAKCQDTNGSIWCE
jgi:hypothetical protein